MRMKLATALSLGLISYVHMNDRKRAALFTRTKREGKRRKGVRKAENENDQRQKHRSAEPPDHRQAGDSALIVQLKTIP